MITLFTWLICVDDSAPQIWIILLDKTYPTLTGCLLSPSALTWLCLKSSPSATFFKYIRCTSFALGLNQLWKLLTFGCCCYAKSCHKHILFLQYCKNEEILSFLKKINFRSCKIAGKQSFKNQALNNNYLVYSHVACQLHTICSNLEIDTEINLIK